MKFASFLVGFEKRRCVLSTDPITGIYSKYIIMVVYCQTTSSIVYRMNYQISDRTLPSCPATGHLLKPTTLKSLLNETAAYIPATHTPH